MLWLDVGNNISLAPLKSQEKSRLSTDAERDSPAGIGLEIRPLSPFLITFCMICVLETQEGL